MDYILYGNVRDKSLRHMTESYIMHHDGRILFYVDDGKVTLNETTEICGGESVPVCSRNAIRKYPDAVIVIMSAMGFSKINENLRVDGIINRVMMAPLLGWRFLMDEYHPPDEYSALVSNWIAEKAGQLYEIYDINDDYTKHILDEIVSEREAFSLIPVNEYASFEYQDYFLESELTPPKDFIFIDCGVYIGDTIESIYKRFGDRLRAIIGFEPDPENVKKALNLVDLTGIKDRVKLFQKGLWNSEGKLRYTIAKDEINFNSNGEYLLPVTCLDAYLSDIESISKEYMCTSKLCQRLDVCIKMDLEGSEISALNGSKEIIRKYNPYMAICLYHRMKDIFEVPKTIMNISRDYKFYLRAGVHTEIYAIPNMDLERR